MNLNNILNNISKAYKKNATISQVRRRICLVASSIHTKDNFGASVISHLKYL